MKRTEILVLTLAVFVVLPGLSVADDLRFERLGSADGLPQSQVNAVLQDRRGFLWIGSVEDLLRFDGYRFVSYRARREPESRAVFDVRALVEDRDGMLWIGTYGDGLDRFDPATERFTHFRNEPANPHSLAHDRVFRLLEDRDGMLWIGTLGGGLDRLNRGSGHFSHFRHDAGDSRSLPADAVTALAQDAAGQLWVGTSRGLARFDAGSETFVRYRHDPADPRSLVHDAITAIAPRRSGGLWVGTARGLDLFDAASGTFRHLRHDPGDPASLAGDRVNALLEDSGGRLWIATEGDGVNRLDPASGVFRHGRHRLADPFTVGDDRVRALYEDRGGLIWAGTAIGLDKSDPAIEAFEHHGADLADPSRGLSSPRVRSVHEGRSGDLWIGTVEGLDRLDRSTGRFDHFRHDRADPASLASDHVSAIVEDYEGSLWVGSPDAGLSRLDPATRRFTHFRHDGADSRSLSSDDVVFLLVDDSGTLWIATWGDGLNRFDRASSSFDRFRHDPADPHSLSTDILFTLIEGSRGEIWIGGWGCGVDRLETRAAEPGSVTFTRFEPGEEADGCGRDDRILALHRDRGGALWLGTMGTGLQRFDPASGDWRRFTARDGLPSHTIYGILPDADGALWLSTSNGLSRFDPAAGTAHNFGISDGLRGLQFNLHAAERGRGGELYFGGKHGLTVVRPSAVLRSDHVPPVVLTDVRVIGGDGDGVWPAAGLLELGPDESVVTFEFAVLDFAAPRDNRYAYRLEGLDDRWVELGTRREVTLVRPEPGEYVLRGAGSHRHGVWNWQGAAVRLLVRSPWWGTAWFRAAVVAGLLGLLYSAYRYRMRLVEGQNRALVIENAERRRAEDERERLIGELEARNQELERFNYTVSHDLKSPLVTIRGFLGYLERDALSGDHQRMRRDIEQIDTAAKTMAQLLDDLLELSRIGPAAGHVEPVDLEEVARSAERLLAESLARRGVELVIAPDLPTVSGDRRRLLEVLQNLLENAVKFMGDQSRPRIEVGLRREPGRKVIYVRDNGVGVKPRYREKIFGLFERLQPEVPGTGLGLAIIESHGGRIWVESPGPGKGSTFCFTIGDRNSTEATSSCPAP